MRHLFQVAVQDTVVVGTVHVPEHGSTRAAAALCTPPPIAMLFLGFGVSPRSGLGGTQAFLADRLADQGYLVLRVDFPGLGDSPGLLPEDMRTFWYQVQCAGQRAFTRSLIAKVVEVFSLDGVVLGGLCAGAVNAVYCADPPYPGVRGLVLLELPLVGSPPFELPRPTHSGPPRRVVHQPLVPTLRRLSDSAKASRHAQRLRTMVRLSRRMLGWVSNGRLGAPANRQLLAALRRVADSTMPVLLLSAGSLPDASLLKPVLRRRRDGSMWCIELGGANHVLTTIAGRHGAAKLIGEWLKEYFPAGSATHHVNEPVATIPKY